MSFEFVLLNGRNKGSVCAIQEDEFYKIGRDASCRICLDDRTASKVHAVLSCQGGKLTLLDMSSRNGTFVNGKRIEKASLVKGDTVTIGNSVFQLAVHGDSSSRADYDSIYPEDEEPCRCGAVPANTLEAVSLTPLSELQSIVHQSSLAMMKQSVKTIFHLLPASRVAVFKTGDRGLKQGYTVVRKKDLKAAGDRRLLSASFAQYVLDKSEPVLISCVRDADRHTPGTAMYNLDSKSIIGVPLIIQGRKKGVLLCDNLDEANAFTPEDLQVVKFVGEEIAPYQEN